jgi:hypothetical protein
MVPGVGQATRIAVCVTLAGTGGGTVPISSGRALGSPVAGGAGRGAVAGRRAGRVPIGMGGAGCAAITGGRASRIAITRGRVRGDGSLSRTRSVSGVVAGLDGGIAVTIAVSRTIPGRERRRGQSEREAERSQYEQCSMHGPFPSTRLIRSILPG